jgi:hypothetical protein
MVRGMYEMTLAVLSLCTLACVPATSNAEPGRQGQPDASPHVITAVPGTISLALDEQTRRGLARHLADGSLAVARLTIRDLSSRAAQGLKGVRVFVEKPNADLSTSVDDPHYAGTFVLGLGASESMLLNIAPTLAKLWQSAELTRATLDGPKTLRITLVSEPWDYAPTLPADFALTIQGVALEIPPQP